MADLFTYPLDFPSMVPLEVEYEGAATVAVSRSPFTGSAQKQVYPRQDLAAVLTFGPMTRAQQDELAVFQLQLNGMEGSFLFGDPAYSGPRGSGSGAPTVDGADQTGQVLETAGWTASATGVLLVGDWIQVGSGSSAQMVKVLEDVDADAAGAASIKVWPGVRNAPTDGAPLELDNPRGVFCLTANTVRWGYKPGQWVEGASIEIQEDY